eukprot:jgi/Phyca11/122667/e_gw1.48.256.1
MPRVSNRERLLSAVRRVWSRLLEAHAEDDDTSSGEEELIEVSALYFTLESRRYLAPRTRVPRPPSRINYYLTDMNETEFKLQFRMTQQYFFAIRDLVADHLEFQCVPGKQRKMSVELHLLSLLKVVGSMDGQGRAADYLSVGSHTPESLLARRMIRALNSFKSDVIVWPDTNERREISFRIEAVSQLPRCIGLIDGTLFPLLSRPQDHGEDYYSRKGSYAINGLVVCDDLCRIRYENIGWPGSSHDNRVWRNSKIAQNKHDHFDEREYLLGDSAYQPSRILVPSFKSPSGGQLALKEEYFNKQLARIRIRVEHCIGILKGRFPLLRRIRSSLRNKKALQDTIFLIRACMIMHNMAIDDPIPSEWIHNENNENESRDLPVCASSDGAERRNYLRDYVYDKNF